MSKLAFQLTLRVTKAPRSLTRTRSGSTPHQICSKWRVSSQSSGGGRTQISRDGMSPEMARILDDSDDIDPDLVGFEDTDEVDDLTADQLEQLQNEQYQHQLGSLEEDDPRSQAAHLSRQASMTDEYYRDTDVEGAAQDEFTQQRRPMEPSPSDVSDIERHQRQVNTWQSIEETMQGIWQSLDSIDKMNIHRIDRTFKKISSVETLHIKSVQHSLHHLALLRGEVAQVNQRIATVAKRVKECESLMSQEWLEWTVDLVEIPFANDEYLRSPGYEIGSMVWCLELRWELDPKHNADQTKKERKSAKKKSSVPDILDLRPDDQVALEKTLDGSFDDDEQTTQEEIDEREKDEKDPNRKRRRLGYTQLGIYLSPRNVANLHSLASLKANCDLRLNEIDKGDSLIKVNDDSERFNQAKSGNSQMHLNINGDFFRDSKLVSWGRTIPNGESVFFDSRLDPNLSSDEKNLLESRKSNKKCVSVKLRVINQTLSYRNSLDSGYTRTNTAPPHSPRAPHKRKKSSKPGSNETGVDYDDESIVEATTVSSDQLETVKDPNPMNFSDFKNNADLNDDAKEEEDLMDSDLTEEEKKEKEAAEESNVIGKHDDNIAGVLDDSVDESDELAKDERQRQLSTLMAMSLEDFWHLFHHEIPAGNVRYGVSVNRLADHCQCDVESMADFRRGPVKQRLQDTMQKLQSVREAESELARNTQGDEIAVQMLDEMAKDLSNDDIFDHSEELSAKEEKQQSMKQLTSKKRARKLKMRQAQLERMESRWQSLLDKDRNYPQWRKNMALFLLDFRRIKSRSDRKRARPY